MAKKRNINSDDLINWYMEFVSKNGEKPKSVSTFAKAYNFKEQLFYDHFSSFKKLEQGIYKVFFEETYSLLIENEEYSNFNARNKLLSFYYTFFELLTLNRTFVYKHLKSQKKLLEPLNSLKELKKVFRKYIQSLDLETLNLHEKTLVNLQSKFLEETAWIQLLGTIKFWLDDTSAGFEKTDILIEKSVNTGFELINIQATKSVLDLGKFLFNETIKK